MFIFYNLNNIYLPLLSTKCSGSFPLNFSRFFHLDTLFPAGWFMNKIAKNIPVHAFQLGPYLIKS